MENRASGHLLDARQFIAPACARQHKWRRSDGTTSQYYEIRDQGFLNDVESRRITFRGGDKIDCEIRQVQVDNDGKLSTYRTIEHVYGVTPGSVDSVQPTLPHGG